MVTVYKEEIETCMRLLGVEKFSELGLKHVSLTKLSVSDIIMLIYMPQVNARALERDIYDGPAGLEKLTMWVQSKL